MAWEDGEPTRFSHLKLANEDGSLKVGGRVEEWVGTVALVIGDGVQLGASGQVTKTATTTNHKNRKGIVVGGKSTDMKVVSNVEALGAPACGAGEAVLVQVDGNAWSKADTNTIAIGDKLKLGSTTAGRLMDGTDTTDGAAGITGSIIGQALNAPAAAGDALLVAIDRG